MDHTCTEFCFLRPFLILTLCLITVVLTAQKVKVTGIFSDQLRHPPEAKAKVGVPSTSAYTPFNQEEKGSVNESKPTRTVSHLDRILNGSQGDPRRVRQFDIRRAVFPKMSINR